MNIEKILRVLESTKASPALIVLTGRVHKELLRTGWRSPGATRVAMPRSWWELFDDIRTPDLGEAL